MTYKMRLATEYFEKVRNGTKTIECRLYDEKRKQLIVGDSIEFSDAQNESRVVTGRIIALHPFPSFEKMVNVFPVASFGAENKEELLEALRKFYPEEEEQKFGVVGIEIEIQK